MKQVTYLFLIINLIINLNTANAQCTDFAKKEGLKVLNTQEYVHDGRFNSIKLKQGDDIYVYKAFYAQESYRIVFIAQENLGDIDVEITDFKRENTLFSNKNGEKYFDFNPKKSQRSIIHITIPKALKEEKSEKGCVAILFGLKKEEE